MPPSRARVSRKVKGWTSTYESDGSIRTSYTTRGPPQIARGHAEVSKRRNTIVQNSTQSERRTLWDIAESMAGGSWEVDQGDQWEPLPLNDDSWETIELDTHALHELTDEVYDNYQHIKKPMRTTVDWRTRCDQVERTNREWEALYPTLVEAYLQWDTTGRPASEVLCPAISHSISVFVPIAIVMFGNRFSLHRWAYHLLCSTLFQWCSDNRIVMTCVFPAPCYPHFPFRYSSPVFTRLHPPPRSLLLYVISVRPSPHFAEQPFAARIICQQAHHQITIDIPTRHDGSSVTPSASRSNPLLVFI
ncbi:hypothetical protein JB92DRAFT_3121598 [Gautieria morchelliformis]|nr:hypothetical protein JB92DRAFT_3121598 [Gautieria morchelliformis]